MNIVSLDKFTLISLFKKKYRNRVALEILLFTNIKNYSKFSVSITEKF